MKTNPASVILIDDCKCDLLVRPAKGKPARRVMFRAATDARTGLVISLTPSLSK
jgi:hypothetical protein